MTARLDEAATPRPRLSSVGGHAATVVSVGAAVTDVLWAPDLREGGAAMAACVLYGMMGTVGFDRVEAKGHPAAKIGLLVASTLTVFAALRWSNGAAWLASMPLISQVVLFTNLRWACGVVGLFLAEFARQDGAMAATELLMNMVGFVAAAVFVCEFTVIAKREVTWRARADAACERLQLVNEQLQSYAQRVEDLTTHRERTRISREIHDSLGHYLTGVHAQLEAAKLLLATAQSDSAMVGVDRAQSLAQRGLEDMRTAVALLRKPDSPGLAAEIEGVVLRFAETWPGRVELDLINPERAPRLDAERQLALVRGIQEGLTNARKHARATRIDVRVEFTDQCIRLAVNDDGLNNPGGPAPLSYGLIGLRERFAEFGGSVRLEAREPAGSRLSIELQP